MPLKLVNRFFEAYAKIHGKSDIRLMACALSHHRSGYQTEKRFSFEWQEVGVYGLLRKKCRCDRDNCVRAWVFLQNIDQNEIS